MAELVIALADSGNVIRIDGLTDAQVRHAKESAWTYLDGKVIMVPVIDNPAPASDGTGGSS